MLLNFFLFLHHHRHHLLKTFLANFRLLKISGEGKSHGKSSKIFFSLPHPEEYKKERTFP
jgi:hypothetical protein